MLEHEAPEHDDADVDEVGGRVVGLDERVDLADEDSNASRASASTTRPSFEPNRL